MKNYAVEKRNSSLLNSINSISIDIEFDNLTYTVPNVHGGKKQVLKGVSGYFRSGELTAIMGPSGAGKSSLLNILTGFRKADGIIKFTRPTKNRNNGTNGTEMKRSRKHSCYILQDDCLDPLFTVEETMKLAADLKLGRKYPKEKKHILIDEILNALMLLPCKHTSCRMISGGQKKRLSVALELIGNPSVMFLDEPTTGLDSLSSHQVITILKNLAHQGRNIICTIHQPSATLFEIFDFVYVMADGKCIYQGSSNNTVSYLASFGLNCPKYHNPADYLLEVSNGEYGKYTEILKINGIEDKWRNQTKNMIACIENTKLDDEISDDGNEMGYYSPPSEFFKLWILLKKSFKKMARDWTISSLKLFLHLCVGIFLGLTYFQVGNDASKMVSNVGFFLVTIVYLCYTSLMPAVLKFPAELNILKKEQYNNWYKLSTYYFAFLLVDIPMQISFVLAYVTGSYILSAQPLDIQRILGFILILFLVNMVASSMGIFFGTIVNPINGTFLGAITLALLLVVAGFLILFTHMSSVMYSLTYVSYISYALEGLAQIMYGYNRQPVPCPENVDYCLFASPADLLKEIGMDKQNYWKDVIFLTFNFICFRIIAYCTLKRTLSKV